MRAKAGREIGVECVTLAAEYPGRQKRRRPDEPGQLRQAPAVLDGELTVRDRLESGTRQHLEIRAALPGQVPSGRYPVFGAERRPPPVQGGGERSLPRCVTCPRLGRPAQRQAAARLEPPEDPAGDQIPGRAGGTRCRSRPARRIPPRHPGLRRWPRWPHIAAPTAAALALTASAVSGSWSTARTSRNQRRSGKAELPGPARQVQQAPALRDLGAPGPAPWPSLPGQAARNWSKHPPHPRPNDPPGTALRPPRHQPSGDIREADQPPNVSMAQHRTGRPAAEPLARRAREARSGRCPSAAPCGAVLRPPGR